MQNSIASEAIQSVLSGKESFCKFLSANDTGLTGAHQAGIHISKRAIPILFDIPGEKGQNKDRWVKILWHDGVETDTRFIYYGQGTRNEYRMTNFGRGFPYLRPEYTGALFILTKIEADYYRGFILNSDNEINQFLDAFGLSPTETNALISTKVFNFESLEKIEFEKFIDKLESDFPPSETMSLTARVIQDKIYNHAEYIRTNPDKKLIEWTEMEYKLFRAIEFARYGEMISKGFSSVDAFVHTANAVLNRRKSRAGKSLEHHLSALFLGNNLLFSSQSVTEGNKKPDFIFPSQEAYHDLSFSDEKLILLAAKTTCKDRWRQVLNEADRLRDKTKYLCTLQQGISPAQMDEMQSEKIILVVPRTYISSYPKDRQDRIWTIEKFIRFAKEIEKS